MELAAASMPTSEGTRDQLKIPDRAKVALSDDLEAVLHRDYVGKKLSVSATGITGWEAKLTGLATLNGQLQLIFGSTIIPYAKINFLSIKS